MRWLTLIACLGFGALLVWLNRAFVPAEAMVFGGLSWFGWLSIAGMALVVGLFVAFSDSARAFGFFEKDDLKGDTGNPIRVLSRAELDELGLDKYRGPSYPHPIIFPERCIGCQACVDACPHDVLAIVDGRASAVAPDLCMEDTACQAECPVNPKACIIINTAKEVRSMPTPTRNGGTYETNVPGCYIIGDVSGVPLIKNAVKEGAEVVTHIREQLAASPQEPKAQYDVAIIGVGPGGASAAATAQDGGLRYIALEQNNILSTIDLYPKGKYIFFKPDTKDWFGGIPVAGLGLAKAKYGGGDASTDDEVIAAIGDDLKTAVAAETPKLHGELIDRIPAPLQNELSQQLFEKVGKELKKRVVAYLRTKGNGDWATLYRTHFAPNKDVLFAEYRAEIADQLQTKIPGDQRENILAVWLSSLTARGVRVNEEESCKAVKKADDGDYFVITSEQGKEKLPQTYTARRVVIAIGLRGAPNKLRLPPEQEDMKVVIDGEEQPRVIYGLSEPMAFKRKKLIVVGGGNVAVEAAVDLCCVRDGAAIRPRDPADMNEVTVLVRDFLAPTVKFGNKYQIYSCAEDGILDLKFGVGVKEIREREVVLEDVRTKQVIATIPNDHIFALIGGERPNRFLESIGIEIK
ncbi:MAG TPA: NAD(P)-binding domain-containing protein [Pyrinomonadaceae bacterium]|nr:NAD(P)-binding domain-containing protein [Pyrinomonadaceae bacterium]